MRYFYTCILPEKLINKHNLSNAACNFSFNLMSGEGFDRTFSVMGTNHDGKMEQEAFEDTRFKLIFSSRLRNMGRLGIFCATILEQWKVFRKIQKGSCVWFYNLDILGVFLYAFLRTFKPSVKINIIVLDFTPSKSRFSLPSLCLHLINKADGNIRLSYSELFTCKNSVTLPGVVPSTSGSEPLVENTNSKYLLSGVLYEQISQISMVLKAFSNLPHCELHITGKTDNEELIKKYAEKFPNIIWHGNVSFQQYLDIMHSCTFQLSTRDPKFPENQCNFPSKVIETLLHNRVVISTIEYKQIEGVKYFKTDSDIKSFQKAIDSISLLTEETLMEYSNQGKKVADMFSTKVWNEAMYKIEQK